jgi:hypothetical protein
MKHVVFFVIVAIIYSLFFLHESYRKPMYIFNTLQENDYNTKIAKTILFIMCVLSFIGGLIQ